MDMHRLKSGSEKREGDSGSHASSIRRRKKTSERPKPPSGYLQEWVHQSRPFMTPTPQYDPQCNQLVGPYWEVAGSPRMFAAFSDPTVCRYSVPTSHPPHLTYSYEPVSLPLYQPAYQPVIPPTSGGPWRSPQHLPNRVILKPNSPKRVGRARAVRPSKRMANVSVTSHHTASSPLSHDTVNHRNATDQEQYLSLPPGIQQGCDLDDSHRRFSDPGLAHTESDSVPNDNNTHDEDHHSSKQASGQWSQSSSASSPASADIEAAALSEQVSLLKADNKRLTQELRDTRAELHKLKLQAATWGSPAQQDYQPGMIADLVREIRDAAQLREETLLSRLRLMMSDGGMLRLTSTVVSEKESTNSLSNQREPSDNFSPDDLKDSERIARLERQLSTLQLHNGGSISSGDLARREDQLRRELLEAQAARKMAESNVNKLERLVSILRKKINGVTLDDGPGKFSPTPHSTHSGASYASGLKGESDTAASPAPSSLESLTSACSSSVGSGPAALTLTGPVTDL